MISGIIQYDKNIKKQTNNKTKQINKNTPLPQKNLVLAFFGEMRNSFSAASVRDSA